MKGRLALATAAALGLAVLPIARSVRADPPGASASATTPAPASTAATPKKRAPAKSPRGKPAKPTPAPKEAAAPKTPSQAGATAHAAPSSAHEVVAHESRIEFDERMVRGQSAAGAIFLFQRTPSELKSIVEIPDSFRSKTVELLQPRGTP